MPYRNLFVQNKAHISIKNAQLCVENEVGKNTINPEDIQTVLIESKQSTITASALSCCSKHGIAVFVCDDSHTPCGVLVPFSQHSRNLEVIKYQLALTAPTQNRIWQQIVCAKIKNQAICLELCGNKKAAERILQLTKAVQSGDKTNQEAVAANFYFKELFGKGFKRTEENGINAALNYGYSIIRGAVARCISSYGFIPALGIHHSSGLNSFNLADDIIEPFRPSVDVVVFNLVDEQTELTPQIKQSLYNILNHDILINGQHHSVAYAVELCVRSLSKILKNSKLQLAVPTIVPISQHRYE